MLTKQFVEESAVITFLENLDARIHSLSDLRDALRSEIQVASVNEETSSIANQTHSDYFLALASIEQVLNSQAVIKVVFANNQQLVYAPFVQKRNIEACLLNIIIRLVKEDNLQ